MEVLPDEQNEAAGVAEPTMAHIEPAWVIARRAESLAKSSEFLTPIPEDVVAAVAPYSSRHWHLLNLIARCPGALDLVRATPALAFALASLWAFRNPAPRQPLRAARALLRKRQPEIAAWLGFPSDRSTMRVLRKISPAECSIPNLLHLRDLLPVHPKPLRHIRILGVQKGCLRCQMTAFRRFHLAHSTQHHRQKEGLRSKCHGFTPQRLHQRRHLCSSPGYFPVPPELELALVCFQSR